MSYRRHLFLAALLAAPACGAPAPGPTVGPRTSPSPPATAPAAPPAPASAPAALPAPASVPAVLGEGLRAGRFEPGRYAADVLKSLRATHARNWVSEDARSSFVLELAAGGTVTACRGQRSSYWNRGPRVDVTTRLREQQGYRGRWRLQDGWVLVDLDTDNGVCPQQRAYTNLAPGPWRLRCFPVEPAHHPVLRAAALACAFATGTRLGYDDERHAHFIPGVLPGGRWLLLGAGNGLRITWHDGTVPPGPSRTKVTVGPSPMPVRDDTWSQPTPPVDRTPGRD